MNKYLKTKEGSIEDLAKQMQNKVMENDYQDKFKKELDKAGKPLGQMTGAEKKSFFNKIDKMHKGKNESLDNKDKPAVKKIITKLKGASQAHADQAKGLEKAMKTEKVDNPYAVGMSQAMKSFKKELDKAGKPLGQMTGAEKKSFFNKIDKMHKGKNENAPSMADIDRLKKQGMKPKPVKEDLDSKDKPTVKKIITKLKGASQAHADQAKGLEKAMKTEKVDNPYAVGMSQAMKSTGDTPPLKKSTITKAHDIAKSIKKDEMKETHMSTAKKQNQSQKDAKGEKEIVKLTAKEDKEWKTFAQMRAEIDEACWDSHKQVGFKMKGGKRVPNCVPKNEEADKGKKEQEAGEDTREKKVKTMTGQVATSPEMNPKVDYKY